MALKSSAPTLAGLLLCLALPLSAWGQGWVDVTDYGANRRDTLADDRAIRRALAVARQRNVSLYFPAGTYYITETIMLDYHNQSVGIVGDGMHNTFLRVKPRAWRGRAYAVYCRTGAAAFRDFSLMGSRSIELSGIYFRFYGGHGSQHNLRVNGFNGFGVKYEAIWDSYVENLIIEHCGNQREWAFTVVGGDDTSNHTTFNRLQVEVAHDRAMYVAPDALNLVFIGIHSERLVREASTRQDVSHHLRGGACSYINARIQNPSTVSKILLGNPEGSYRDFRCGGQDVEISYGAPTPQQRVRGLTCRTLRIPADNQSPVYLEDVVVNNVFIENQTEHYPVFRDCTIRGAVEHRGRSSRAVFINCYITDPRALRRTPGKNKVKSSLF